MSESSESFYQKFSAYPLMASERRQELLEHFYSVQEAMISGLVAYMVPLYRYFAQELENRNFEEADETLEAANPTARVSRLKAAQLKQIAKMLMDLRQAYEMHDGVRQELLQGQFRELMLGFDYALLSTLCRPSFLEPQQVFLLDVPQTEEVVQRLKSLIRDADEDRDALFKGNWRLVMEIARRFQAFGSKLDADELVQEGNTGLLAAIDKFNPNLKLQLSTLAANWIQAKIRRAMDNLSETIRTPVYKRQRKKLVQKAELELLLEKQSAPQKGKTVPPSLLTSAEQLFGKTIDDREIAERTGFSAEEVSELRRLYPETVSINASVDNAEPSNRVERGDLLPDKTQNEEELKNKTDRKILFELLTRLVDELPLTHQVVLSGLNGLPIRKKAYRLLVEEKIAIMQRQGRSLARGAQIAGKALIQIFK